MIEVIFPSAGHHDKDPGAISPNSKMKEADLTKEFRNLVTQFLEELNAKFITDKDNETNSQYQSRIKPGTGSVILDVHFNASANPLANGTEMIVNNNASDLSIQMAEELAKGTAQILGIKNRGVKTERDTARGRIGILNLKAGISVLAEICFLTNAEDITKYFHNKEELACFYAQTLIKYDNMV